MPPILALFLCTAFVLFLLRLDKKQAPDVSSAMWIPTIWMLLISSKPLGLWFGNEDAEASPLDRNFLIVLFLISVFLLINRRFNLSRAIKENIYLILLTCFMLVSIIWSDIPDVSFKRWIKELIAVVMGFLVLIERDPRQAVLSIFRRTVYILIPFSLILIKYYPEYGVEYGRWSGEQQWVGVATQKNGLGRLCFIATFFLVWSFFTRWQKHAVPIGKHQTIAEVFVLSIAIWLLLAGGEGKTSATAISTLVVGFLAFASLFLLKKYKMLLGVNALQTIIVFIIIFALVTVFTSGASVGIFTSSVGRDATLTGRTETWAQLIPVAMQQPIFGGGFASFWTERTHQLYMMSHAHNGYLEILLELGFVGLLLYLIFLLSCCRKAYRELTYNFDWGVFYFCFLLMVLIYNIAESSMNSFSTQLMATLLLLSVASTSKKLIG